MSSHANLYLLLDTSSNEETNWNTVCMSKYHGKMYVHLMCTQTTESDKPGHPYSLVSAFTAHKAWK